MLNDFVIVGLGQLGQLYGAGALRAGFRVTPLRRNDDPGHALRDVPPRVPVLIAVGESDLADAVARLPPARHEDVILIQNELFPGVWQAAKLTAPSLAVPWVLKKPGLPVTVARATPIYGRYISELAAIHDALELPVERLSNETAVGQALVSKYAFILTINALGVAEDRSLGEWLERDEPTVHAVLSDALALGEAKLGEPVKREAARADTAAAMRALARVPARGRSARGRLDRALADAALLGVEVPALQDIAASAGQ